MNRDWGRETRKSVAGEVNITSSTCGFLIFTKNTEHLGSKVGRQWGGFRIWILLGESG